MQLGAHSWLWALGIVIVAVLVWYYSAHHEPFARSGPRRHRQGDKGGDS